MKYDEIAKASQLVMPLRDISEEMLAEQIQCWGSLFSINIPVSLEIL
jgi:hypothetical protein